MPYAPANGIELYYEVHGDGPPLVFAHGAGGNHAVWYQQVPFFSKSYQVITFDHRGFGHSEDTNDLGRGSFVEDLRDLLVHLGINKVSLVAQSMGGGTCMGFTVRFPERTNALVMADTLAGITLPDDLRAHQQANAEATRNLSQIDRVVSKTLPQRDPAKAELYLQIASFNKQNANRFNMTGTQPAPITMDQVMAAARTVPMLFLVGEEDILQPPEIVSAASRLVPNAQLAVVPNAGHSVYFEQPEVFNYQVARFLAGVLAHE
jgi:3-oxoadipate enol-lactonase